MFSLRSAILIIPSLLISSTLCVPQGVMEIIRPPGASPPGCIDSYPGAFGLRMLDHPTTGIDNYPGAFGLQMLDHPTTGIETQCMEPGAVKMSLSKGLLVDHLGRIGSIVANRQFQFDGPPAQAGAIYTGGWSICPDNLIALGPQKQFYGCASGGFDNIYDSMIANYCIPVFLKITPYAEC